MERLGPREYRCNHCGAITVVSQDGASAAQARTGAFTPSGDRSAATVYPPPAPSGSATSPMMTALGRLSPRGWFLLVFLGLILASAFAGLSTGRSNSTPNAVSSEKPQPPTAPPVSTRQLALSQPAWMTDPANEAKGGKYVSMLYNHSPWPIQVPRYTLTLYTDGIKGASAESEAPLARLLPGEYEPISFALETPSGNNRTETVAPDFAERTDTPGTSLPLTQAQLTREEGKPGYRLVGVLQNDGKSPVNSVQMLVMLFGANRMLIGYGTGFARSMRPGEKATVDVHMPTANQQPVLRYEYLVDATRETE